VKLLPDHSNPLSYRFLNFCNNPCLYKLLRQCIYHLSSSILKRNSSFPFLLIPFHIGNIHRAFYRLLLLLYIVVYHNQRQLFFAGWRKYLYMTAIHRFLRDAPSVDVHIVTQETD